MHIYAVVSGIHSTPADCLPQLQCTGATSALSACISIAWQGTGGYRRAVAPALLLPKCEWVHDHPYQTADKRDRVPRTGDDLPVLAFPA